MYCIEFIYDPAGYRYVSQPGEYVQSFSTLTTENCFINRSEGHCNGKTVHLLVCMDLKGDKRIIIHTEERSES